MRCFQCPACAEVEITSNKVRKMEHDHNGVIVPLDGIPVNSNAIANCSVISQVFSQINRPRIKKLTEKEILDALKKLEFKEGGNYLLIFNSSMIDFDTLIKLDMSNFPECNLMFISAHNPGESIDNAILMKESLYDIQDWIMKAFERSDTFERRGNEET